MPKKSFLGLISIDDGKQEAAPAKSPVKGKAMPAAPDGSATLVTAIDSSMADEDIKQSLAAALDKTNQSGFDYYEFAAAVESQKAHMPAESVRFQSVFSTAAVMGVTIAKLLESADFYLGVLEKEKTKFIEAESQMTQQEVTAKEDQLAKIDEDIQTISQQIAEMTEKINKLQESKSTLNNEIGENKLHIQQTNAKFMASLNYFVTKIEGDKEKIKKYLSNAGADAGKGK